MRGIEPSTWQAAATEASVLSVDTLPYTYRTGYPRARPETFRRPAYVMRRVPHCAFPCTCSHVRACLSAQMSRSGVNVKDVSAHEFVTKYGQYLKRTGKIEVPPFGLRCSAYHSNLCNETEVPAPPLAIRCDSHPFSHAC